MNQDYPMPDDAIPFREVPALLPRRNGKKVHYKTISRWATRGVRGRRLDSRLIGGIRYTSLEALCRFMESITIEANRNTSDEILRRFISSRKSRN